MACLTLFTQPETHIYRDRTGEHAEILQQRHFMIDRDSEDYRRSRPSYRTVSPRPRRTSGRPYEQVQAGPQSLRRSKRLAGQEPSPDQDDSPGPSRKRRTRGEARSEEAEPAPAVGDLTDQTASQPDEPCGRITAALSSQPPPQVRTGSIMPRLGVRVTIEGTERLGPSMGLGTLHAVVSLWSADGQVAVPHAVPPILTGHRDATLVNIHPTAATERRVEANFTDLAIGESGHYRLRVSIMETPLSEGEDDRIDSPRQLLSIETRPIHAYGFADMI